MRSILKYVLVLVSLCSVTVFAQQKKSGRPFKEADVSKIPVVHSLQEYIQKYKGTGSLKNSAVTVGVAGKEAFAPVAKETIKVDPVANNKPMSIWKVARAENGTVNWMWNVHSKSNMAEPQSIRSNDGMKVLTEMKQALRLQDPSSELRLMSDKKDELGSEHIRYAQYYKDIPVWNSDLYVHFGLDGYPYVINGTYQPTPVSITTTPEIVPEAATIVCIHDLQVKGAWAPVTISSTFNTSLSSQPEAKLVIFPIEGKQPKLAYQVSVNANLLQSYYYIIDATTGEIIQRTDHYCSLVGDTKLPKAAVIDQLIQDSKADPFPLLHGKPVAMPQAGFVSASGTDLNGATQQFRTYQHTDGKFYLIWDLASFNPGASQLPDQPSGGALTLNLNNQDYAQGSSIFHNVSTNNSWNDPTAISAHFNTSVAYNYYSSTFARKSIDDNNGVITSIIHVAQNGGGMDNAFWNGGGKVMIYGDGKTDFKPLAGGLDVAGHEMTHGVTENSANLVYQNQSGALNESMSDVFGVMMDAFNFTLGEQVMKSSQFSCLRDLANPHNPTAFSDQPAKMSEFKNLTIDQDNGGVHINSGIPNCAAGILIKQISRGKAQLIYYRALTQYLTRESQFIDCRRALIQAANDLDHSGGDAAKVAAAFDQVEIFDNTPGSGNDNVHPQSGGTELIAFFAENGKIGFVRLPGDTAFFFNDAFAFVRLGSATQSPSILTAPRSGSDIWFIDPTLHLSFIEMATGTVKTFPNLFITDDGDLWNASISPDGTIVAIASAYLDDPNIYFFDGTQLARLPLVTQENDGGSVQTIDYPDVISWGPSAKNLKISFDALNIDKIGGTNLEYWSIYEIDSSFHIYNLIPSADKTIDLGNICYSNTNPDLITFNAISGGLEDVLLVNFDLPVDQQLTDLETYTKTVNGNLITDGNRPTFSPNDKKIVFSSVNNTSLLYYEIASKNLEFRKYNGFSLNMPFWFLIGGAEGVHHSIDESKLLLSVQPTVIGTSGDISVTLTKAADISLDVLNIYGVTVRSIVTKHLDIGSNHFTFDRSSLASGTYFIRLRAGDEQKTCKIIIE